MKINRLATLLAIFLIFLPLSLASQEKNTFVIYAKDGTKTSYALNEQPKLSFTETHLVITTNGIEVNYDLDNMEKFTYEYSESSNVTDLRTDNPIIKLDGENLLLSALPANSSISIYSSNGTLVFQKDIRQAGKYAFPLSNLEKGVYIIKTNSLTHKILKK